MTTAEIQMEVAEIKSRLKHLESAVREIVARQRHSSATLDSQLSNQELVAWMCAHGVVRDPIPEELLVGAQWDALSEVEKQGVLWGLDHLSPGPMASDIIIEGQALEM